VGSYANGTWGVGSDVDIIIVVHRADQPFPRRTASIDASSLPVPADVLVYTVEELDRVSPGVLHETIWVFTR
jgi:predicted nucleotidyltransferase